MIDIRITIGIVLYNIMMEKTILFDVRLTLRSGGMQSKLLIPQEHALPYPAFYQLSNRREITFIKM